MSSGSCWLMIYMIYYPILCGDYHDPPWAPLFIHSTKQRDIRSGIVDELLHVYICMPLNADQTNKHIDLLRSIERIVHEFAINHHV